jgi:hypothetical protein
METNNLPVVTDGGQQNQNGRALKPLVREPLISLIGDAIDVAHLSHLETGGSTVSIFDGNLVGKKLYALSIFPGRTVELLEPPTWRQLFAFALENSEPLLRKNCALGTWYHRARRVHVFDVVVCISNLQAALELAKCFDQESIYSLEHGHEIAVPYDQVISLESIAEGGNE